MCGQQHLCWDIDNTMRYAIPTIVGLLSIAAHAVASSANDPAGAVSPSDELAGSLLVTRARTKKAKNRKAPAAGAKGAADAPIAAPVPSPAVVPGSLANITSTDVSATDAMQLDP